MFQMSFSNSRCLLLNPKCLKKPKNTKQNNAQNIHATKQIAQRKSENFFYFISHLKLCHNFTTEIYVDMASQQQQQSSLTFNQAKKKGKRNYHFLSQLISLDYVCLLERRWHMCIHRHTQYNGRWCKRGHKNQVKAEETKANLEEKEKIRNCLRSKRARM